MKKFLIFMGMILFLNLNCDSSWDYSKKNQHYESQANRLNTGENVPDVPPPQTRTFVQPVYIVAGTVPQEWRALQEAQKLSNYGFNSQVYRAPNGVYVITTGFAENMASAVKLREQHSASGLISTKLKTSYGKDWQGPIFTSTPNYATPPPQPVNQPASTAETYAEDSYLESGSELPGTSPAPIITNQTKPADVVENPSGLVYIVLTETREEERAIEMADQYIRQGAAVYVYETTQGYSVTAGKAQNRQVADAERQRLARENGIHRARLVPQSRNWKRLIYP